MKEVWKDVVGYEGLYKVSNHGKVWSCKGRKQLSLIIVKGDYETVPLSREGSRNVRCIHNLVAEHFIGGDTEGMQVDHIDSDHFNNRVDNLRYATVAENNKYRDEKLARFSKLQRYLIDSEETRELWRDIDEYEDLYAVSTYGRVYSYKSDKILRWSYDWRKHGKIMVKLYSNKKSTSYTLSRIVAKAFLVDEFQYNKQFVSYKDNDRTNVKFNNLYYSPHNYLQYKHLLGEW